jgi:hypothetical protein
MIPYKSNLATAIPKALGVRLAIIRAIGRLKEQCENEWIRLRRAEIASLRHELEDIARDLRKAGREWPLLVRSELRKAGFNPSEPRVPAGNPDGGQWTNDGGHSADDSRVLSDAPSTGWIPGAQYAADGHHWVPKGVYEKEALKPEVKRVFENAKSGPLADNSVNRWNVEHRNYNDAVQEDFNAFLQRNKITSQQMTPDQARQFVDEVFTSADPRIRALKMKVMHQMLRYFLLRGPLGGDEE